MTFNKILTAAACCLAVFIAAATVIAFVSKKAQPGINLREADPVPQQVQKTAGSTQQEAAFTGIGRLRASTKPETADSTGVTVVITPWFSYPADDKTFYEELARKSGVIKSVILQYFSQYTEKQLRSIGEEKIKADILGKINGQLVLGKIKAVYFSDYIFLE